MTSKHSAGLVGNAAGFLDVPCVRYYQTIRKGVAADAGQIGYGINRVLPAPVVRQWLTQLYKDFLVVRVTDYDTSEARTERELIAWLAGRYLGVNDLCSDNVVLCNGSSEAISIVMAYGGRRGMEALLPLPLYFSFEQSSSRHGLPIVGYYNLNGAVALSTPIHLDKLLVVDVAPNGVAGGWAENPYPRRAALTVIDHVFALPTFEPPAVFLANLRQRVGQLEQSVVLMTPSKDLSIPGIRCGTLITHDPDLLAHAGADRFERGYTVHGASARVSAAHLALLLLTFEPERGRPALVRVLRQKFAAAGLQFLTDEQAAIFASHVAQMRTTFQNNIHSIDSSGLFRTIPSIGDQAAGYSGFRALNDEFKSAGELTTWIQRVGRDGIKLNPNYLFGADPTIWDVLYPGVFGVRVNISVPPDQLARDLALLQKIVQNQDLAV